MIVFAYLFITVCAIVLNYIRLKVVFNHSKDNAGSQEFLVAGTVFSSYPLALLTQIIFLLRRSALLAFFADWRRQLADIDDRKSMKGLEKKIYLIYCIYFGYTFLNFGALSVTVLYNQPDMDNWASKKAYGQYARPVEFFLLGSSLIVNIFSIIIDIVPTFVYYQAGLAIKVLVDRWESILLLKDPSKVQRIVSIFNTIANLVTRADYLFGPIIVLNHGIMFFFICTYTSSILKPPLPKEPESIGIQNFLICNLIFLLARLIWSIVFKFKLYGSSERLKAVVLSSYSESSSTTAEYQKSSSSHLSGDKSVKKFAFLLSSKFVVACPCGLYYITPSIFLTMLSLLATYTIILFQSQC